MADFWTVTVEAPDGTFRRVLVSDVLLKRAMFGPDDLHAKAASMAAIDMAAGTPDSMQVHDRA